MSGEAPAALAAGLRKSFRAGRRRGEPAALDGLDLRVERGSALGLLGPNASGKSTTLKILAGLLAADAGRAEVCGWAAGTTEAKRRLGYLPERDGFYRHLTPRENLAFAAALRGLGRRAARRLADSLLERFGLTECAGVRCSALSKGLSRRLGLAASLVGEPELLLWDEPWDGLDPEAAARLGEIIAELRGRGAAILMTGHPGPDILDHSDRLAVLRRGRAAAAGPAGDFTPAALFEMLRGTPNRDAT